MLQRHWSRVELMRGQCSRIISKQDNKNTIKQIVEII